MYKHTYICQILTLSGDCKLTVLVTNALRTEAPLVKYAFSRSCMNHQIFFLSFCCLNSRHICMYMYVNVLYVGLGGPTGSREGGSRYVSIMHPDRGGQESYGRCDAYHHHYDRILYSTRYFMYFIVRIVINSAKDENPKRK